MVKINVTNKPETSIKDLKCGDWFYYNARLMQVTLTPNDRERLAIDIETGLSYRLDTLTKYTPKLASVEINVTI